MIENDVIMVSIVKKSELIVNFLNVNSEIIIILDVNKIIIEVIIIIVKEIKMVMDINEIYRNIGIVMGSLSINIMILDLNFKVKIISRVNINTEIIVDSYQIFLGIWIVVRNFIEVNLNFEGDLEEN